MKYKSLPGKFLIEGELHCLTGLHIGGNKETSEIGSVDLLVVRDPISQEPYIPGSSIKGKMRSLLERYHFAVDPAFNIVLTRDPLFHRHECGSNICPVCRIFGSGNAGESSLPARLCVRDAHLTQDSKDELLKIEGGYYLTEIKIENTLDRITAKANPRQIERIPRGARFSFSMIYSIWEREDSGQFKEDLNEILTALQLLQDDYLGGHGSRGYGQIDIQNLKLVWRSMAYYRGEEQEVAVISDFNGSLREIISKVQEWVDNFQKKQE